MRRKGIWEVLGINEDSYFNAWIVVHLPKDRALATKLSKALKFRANGSFFNKSCEEFANDLNKIGEKGLAALLRGPGTEDRLSFIQGQWKQAFQQAQRLKHLQKNQNTEQKVPEQSSSRKAIQEARVKALLKEAGKKRRSNVNPFIRAKDDFGHGQAWDGGQLQTSEDAVETLHSVFQTSSKNLGHGDKKKGRKIKQQKILDALGLFASSFKPTSADTKAPVVSQKPSVPVVSNAVKVKDTVKPNAEKPKDLATEPSVSAMFQPGGLIVQIPIPNPEEEKSPDDKNRVEGELGPLAKGHSGQKRFSS